MLDFPCRLKDLRNKKKCAKALNPKLSIHTHLRNARFAVVNHSSEMDTPKAVSSGTDAHAKRIFYPLQVRFLTNTSCQ